jgi:hypothetical protein
MPWGKANGGTLSGDLSAGCRCLGHMRLSDVLTVQDVGEVCVGVGVRV